MIQRPELIQPLRKRIWQHTMKRMAKTQCAEGDSKKQPGLEKFW